MFLFRTKSIDAMLAAAERKGGLKRVLGPANLVSLGIGAIIGTGIFVLTGQAAAMHAGPAIVISMIVAGVVSALAGLCYAELASTVPIAGSAYTYAYATLGELVAWIIGWDLVLEYALGRRLSPSDGPGISSACSTTSESHFQRLSARPLEPCSRQQTERR